MCSVHLLPAAAPRAMTTRLIEKRRVFMAAVSSSRKDDGSQYSSCLPTVCALQIVD